MTQRTLARLERILVMVPWLLDHPGAAVDEVTGRFGTTRAQLLDDLDVLGYCGLPGYGGGDLVEATVVGDRITVRLADFFRRPLTLSVREAVALLLAGRAMADLPGGGGPLASAVAKLSRALGADPALTVAIAAEGDDWLPLLRTAVTGRHVVRVRYRSRSKEETTQRDVEPWALVGAHGTWYLRGWCRMARDERAFRLDRIEAAQLAGPTADALPRATVRSAAGPPAYVPAPGDRAVVLDLEPDAWWVPERVVADRLEDLGGGVRRLHLRVGALELVARLVLSLAPAARVVSPPELAERVAELASAVLARHSH